MVWKSITSLIRRLWVIHLRFLIAQVESQQEQGAATVVPPPNTGRNGGDDNTVRDREAGGTGEEKIQLEASVSSIASSPKAESVSRWESSTNQSWGDRLTPQPTLGSESAQVVAEFEQQSRKNGLRRTKTDSMSDLQAYEAQVERIRQVRILKFKIKWMDTLSRHAQMQLQEIDQESFLENAAEGNEIDSTLPDQDLVAMLEENYLESLALFPSETELKLEEALYNSIELEKL